MQRLTLCHAAGTCSFLTRLHNFSLPSFLESTPMSSPKLCLSSLSPLPHGSAQRSSLSSHCLTQHTASSLVHTCSCRWLHKPCPMTSPLTPLAYFTRSLSYLALSAGTCPQHSKRFLSICLCLSVATQRKGQAEHSERRAQLLPMLPRGRSAQSPVSEWQLHRCSCSAKARSQI